MTAKEATEVAERARKFLGGTALSPDEVESLARALQGQKAFGLAQRVLERARDPKVMTLAPKLRKWAREQQAVSTYKDPDRPADSRFDEALRILTQDGVDLDNIRDQETLGIAGAIYKRRWEWGGMRADLERSLGFYIRGETEGPAGDYGYTGINAAFVLDLLAHLEDQERPSRPSEAAKRRREQALEIRTKLVAALPDLPQSPDDAWLLDKFWYWATLGEASFGLLDDGQATKWLARAAEVRGGVSDWERESTVRQLVWLLSFRSSEKKDSGEKALSSFLSSFPDLQESAASALKSLLQGKVGIALSGGGFRASLFHIGVLARLAELDVLRHVEVLSCVSGGSIIGAHYYLEVRHLLQTKTDAEVGPKDYVDIVERLERDFLAGVQRNLRMRIGANLLSSLKMLLVPGYSRTHRLGELYESDLYSRVPDGNGGAPRWLDELRVTRSLHRDRPRHRGAP